MNLASKLASIAAAVALLAGSPAVAAGAPSASPDAWVTFSQLNPAGATALAGSSAVATIGTAATAAQPVEAEDARGNPFPWPVAVVLLGVVAMAVYIALIEKHHGHFTFPSPTSPS